MSLDSIYLDTTCGNRIKSLKRARLWFDFFISFFSERLWDARVGEKLIVSVCKNSHEVARELFVIVKNSSQKSIEFMSQGRLCPRN